MSRAASGFSAELPGWILRGSVCALTSFGWAVAAGFSHPAEIVGMIFGVAAWVAAFAWITAWLPEQSRGIWARYGPALKRAAWLKFGFTLLGVPALLGVWGGAGTTLSALLGYAFTFDLMLGLASLSLTGYLTGGIKPEAIAQLDSWGWTACTTVVEGTLMAAVIGLMALLIIGWEYLRAQLAVRKQFTPVRSVD